MSVFKPQCCSSACGGYQISIWAIFMNFWDMRLIQSAKCFWFHWTFHFYPCQYSLNYGRAPRGSQTPFKSQNFAQNLRFIEFLYDFIAPALGRARTICTPLERGWKIDVFCTIRLKFNFKTRWTPTIWVWSNIMKKHHFLMWPHLTFFFPLKRLVDLVNKYN